MTVRVPESLFINLPSPDPLATSYNVYAWVFNASRGQYDLLYEAQDLAVGDFPHDVPGGIASGYMYVVSVKALVNDNAQRSLSFASTITRPVCK